MKPTACWGALALTLTPFGVWALGLGDIELSSALNQPLVAEIELVSATDDELTTLRIELASFETFERYGLDRPAFLDGISFQINVDDFGNAAVAVSSQEPIAEPFVTILVEASWARGRLLREYTVLLDPPVLLPVPEVAANVQPAQAGATAPAEPAAAINRPAATTITPATTPVLETLEPVETAAAPAPAPLSGSYGPVQPAETLWSIAAQSRPAGVTMNQMMVAIYEANPQSFSGNMNTLHQGATLRIPQSDELAAISAAAATQEAIRQAALWEGGTEDSARLRLVTPESTEDTAVTGGGTETAVAAATDGVASAAVADLEGELESLRGELENNQRLLEIRDQQLQDLQAQLAAAEAAEASAEPGADAPVEAAGVDLESEPLFADEQPGETAPVEEQTPAVVTPAATTGVVTTPAEPSLISTLLGFLLSPILLIALGLIALTGTAVWYLRYRQQDADDVTGRWEALEADIDEDEDADASSFVVAEGADVAEAADGEGEDDFAIDAPTASEPEADQDIDTSLDLESELAAETEASDEAGDDSSPSAHTMTIGVPPSEPAHNETISSQTVINLEQADPVAEADFHMAYGLYDQAAELVEKALEAEPGRRDLTLKLLEVFFVWGNKDSFLEAAQVLHSEIGTDSDSDWDKVVIMGKQICPDEALFSAAPASAGSVDVDLDAGDSPALDLSFDADDSAGVDLDAGDSPALDLSFDADDGAGVDLDLGDMDAPDVDLELEASGSQAIADESAAHEELDVGDQTAAGLAAALFEQSASDDDATLTDADLEIDIAAAAGEDIEVGLDDDAEEVSDLLADSALTDDQDVAGELGNNDETFTDEDADSLAATQESPTVESPISPTAEETGADEDAADSPTVESALEGTGELPTIEQPGVVEDSRDPADRTAEIDLDDLGLDVDELSNLTNDLGVLADLGDDSPSAIADGELSSADVSDVLESEEAAEAVADQDETLLASDIEDETPLAIGDKDATMEAPGRPDADDSALADQDATLLAPSTSDSGISDLGDQDATMLAPGYGGSAADGTTNMPQTSAEDLGVDASITDVLEGGSPSAEDTLSEPGPAAGEELVSDTLEQEALPSADHSITDILEGSEDVAATTEFNTELDGALAGQNADDTATVEASSVEAESGIDLNLDEVASALEGSDTVEQPIAQSVGSDVFPEPTESTHLDIGAQTSLGDETMSGQSGLLDPHTMTMTEVGTKLDLARAYVDMGDPDGARSILDEVLEEGDEDQQTEANKIIKDL